MEPLDNTDVQQQDRVLLLLERLGRAYLERHEFGEAFEKYSQLLELSPEHPEYLLNAAVAAVGMRRTTPETMMLYQKAIESNPESTALKAGLATLFMQQNIRTSFAVAICEQALHLHPPLPNSHKLRLFLKDHYEETGDTVRLSQIEHEVVFSTGNIDTIRRYLQGLWWEGKFEEAEAALGQAHSLNGLQNKLHKELTLTNAYKIYARKLAVPQEQVADFKRHLQQIDIRRSFADLREYLLVRAILSGVTPTTEEESNQIEEYQFILGDLPLDELLRSYETEPQVEAEEPLLGPFSCVKEILNVLPRPEQIPSDGLEDIGEIRSIFCLNLVCGTRKRLVEKILGLVSLQLARLQQAFIRQAGCGFLCLSAGVVEPIELVVQLLRHLEEYNAFAEPDERIFLAATAVCLQGKRGALNDEIILNELLQATHFALVAEKAEENANGAAGIFYLRGNNAMIKKFPASGITLLDSRTCTLLPGLETVYYEVIWRNPLLFVEKGKCYRIGRFELRENLVKHKTYATFRAHDTQLDRPVIVKIIQPEEAVDILKHAAKRDELLEKLKALGRLNHANIANLYDMGEQSHMLFFVREYIDGTPITQYAFAAQEKQRQVLTLLQTLIRALIHAQRQGICHLNLKPANIWMSEAQQLKIADFSLPGFHSQTAKKEVLYPGQWRYMAPELLTGDSADFRSDIYSIGVLTYELLTGEHPYTTTGQITRPHDLHKVAILPISQHKTAPHSAWEAWVMKAMAVEPDQRFQSFSEMEIELRKVHLQLMQQVLGETA